MVPFCVLFWYLLPIDLILTVLHSIEFITHWIDFVGPHPLEPTTRMYFPLRPDKQSAMFNGIAMSFTQIVGLLIAILVAMPQGAFAQCALQVPAWSGQSYCGYSKNLTGVVQGGTADVITWTGTGAGYLSATDIAAPFFDPPANSLDVPYTFIVTANDANGVPCTNSPLTLSITVLATPQAQFTTTPAPSSSNTHIYDDIYNVTNTWSYCTGTDPANISFTDNAITTSPTLMSVNWGVPPNSTGLSPSWTGISRSYPLGFTPVEYIVTNGNGCSDTLRLGIYNGQNTPPEGPISAPSIPLVSCEGYILSVPVIGGANNPPGTLYEIGIDDGSAPYTLEHPLASPMVFTFDETSCGNTTLQGHQEAFSITVNTYNACGAGTTVNVAPIRIVNAPVAGFTMNDADHRLCTSQSLQLQNVSLGQSIVPVLFNNLLASCIPLDTLYWEITPGGAVIGSGNLGSDGGNPLDPSAWIHGTNNVSVSFPVPGTYTIRLHIGNACGISVLEDTVCVSAPSVADFNLSLPSPSCLTENMVVAASNTSTLNGICSGVSYSYSASGQDICDTSSVISFSDPASGPSSPNPQWNIDGPGTYAITMHLNDSICPVSNHVENITVHAPPSFIIPSNLNICDVDSLGPLSVSPVSCDGTTPIVTWEYQDATNTTIPPGVNGNVFGPIADPVSGIIIITATSAGCPTPVVDTITVSISTTPPSVNIAALDSSICISDELTLTADLIPNATYTWTGPSPVNIPAGTDSFVVVSGWLPGEYSVSVSLGGCEGPPSYVTITELITPTLTVTGPQVLCPGVSSTVLRASGADNYVWADGNVTVSELDSATIYAPGGDIIVTGILANGCSAQDTVTVSTVNTVPHITVFPDTGCVGTAMQFNDLTVGATDWDWDFGDNTLPHGMTDSETHVYAISGNYTVTLIVNADTPCPVDTSFSVVINETTTPTFTLDSAVGCSGETFCVINTSVATTPTTYTWLIANEPPYQGPNPPCNVLTAAGVDAIYYVELTTSVAGCPDQVFTDQITVNPFPVATLGYSWPADSSTCSPLEVTFVNLSQANWDETIADTIFFSNGTTQQPFPNNTPVDLTFTAINVPVVYTATLHTWNACGMDADAIEFTVLPPLVGAFFDAPEPVCAGEPVQFTSLAAGAQSWSWTFGDGNGSYDENHAHTYEGWGYFPVHLHVNGYCGQADWDDVVQVLEPPVAAFTLDTDSLCEGASLNVTTSTLGMANYAWTWGDTHGSGLTLPSHVYAEAGTYTVTLVVTDDQFPACSHDTAVVVTVLPVPNDSVTVSHSSCEQDTVHFQLTAQNSANYAWDFGDSTPTSTLPSPIHLYPFAGNFIATLTSTAPGGCTQVQEFPIPVGQTPVAVINLDPVDPCASPAAVSAVTGTNPPGTQVQWFLDGLFASDLEQLSTSTTVPGDHTLLLLNVLGGCSASDSTTFHTELLPIPAFSVDTACQGIPAAISNNSQFSHGYWWTWVGADSVIHHDDRIYPIMVFDAPGLVSVGLQVTGSGGCFTELTQTVSVSWFPRENFTSEPGEACGWVKYSVAVDSSSLSYIWNYGDGGPWIENRPGQHDFTNAEGPGFNTCLRVANSVGCADTICHTVFVEPCVWVPNAFTPNDDMDNEIFQPVVWPLKYMDSWSVFDRWGKEVFTTEDPNVGWDGTFNGMDCPIDVYLWQMHILGKDGRDKPEARSGHVTLIR